MKKFTMLIVFASLALLMFASMAFAHHKNDKVIMTKAGTDIVADRSAADAVKKADPTEKQKAEADSDALVASSKEKSAPGDQGKKKKDVIYVYMKAIPEPSSTAYVEMMATSIATLNGSSPGRQIGGGQYSAHIVPIGTSTIFF